MHLHLLQPCSTETFKNKWKAAIDVVRLADIKIVVSIKTPNFRYFAAQVLQVLRRALTDECELKFHFGEDWRSNSWEEEEEHR